MNSHRYTKVIVKYNTEEERVREAEKGGSMENTGARDRKKKITDACER